MRRTALLFAILFATFWQSVAVSRAGSAADAVADLPHAALHWQEDRHHHHDDGTYHLDDSAESTLHLWADQISVPAMLPHEPASLAGLRAVVPASRLTSPGPHPFLDGPLRPPRTTT